VIGMDALADTTIAVLVFATLATAWSWLGAYAGIVSFAHAVFFGIGAYAVAVSNLRGGSPWYGALGGALFAVLLALLCGLLCLRGRGYTFALVTLLLGALAEPVVATHHWLAPHDVLTFPIRTGFLNLQVAQKWPYVLLVLVVFVVAQLATLALRSSRIGFYLRAVRDSPPAARGVGVAALPSRLIVLAASAFFTSVVGSFCAEYALGVTPHATFALSLAFDIAFIGVVAGATAPWGAPLAGLVYALVAKLVPLHPQGPLGMAILVIEGAAIVFIVLARRDGSLRTAFWRSPVAGVRVAV
jgi:branched-chain amino acid transport system permease protein